MDERRHHRKRFSGPPSISLQGKILHWDPRMSRVRVKVAPVAEMPLGQNAIFSLRIDPQGSSTLLTSPIDGSRSRALQGFLPGNHAFLTG